MKRWTVDDLRALDACEEQVAMFEKTFPDGATADDVGAAVAAGLNVRWLVEKVVSDEVWRAYAEAEATLRRAYAEARAPLRRAYQEARALLRRAYQEAREPLWRAYQEAEATLWRAYEEAREPLLADALRTVEAARNPKEAA